jgi:DNA-binding NarL/FixJ family response regulator
MSGVKTKIKILLVDDHPVVRQGLRALLAQHEELKIVGEAADGAQAVLKVQELQPDLVLMDLEMPGVDGLQATESLHKGSPRIKVLVLSMYHPRDTVARIIRAGARGYVLKNSPTEELLRAIHAVQAGEPFFSPAVARAASGGDAPDPLALLSSREREVLAQLADGRTNKEVAAHLGVSVRTAESHRERIMDKLNIRSLAGLTRFAIAHGVTTLDAEKTI